MIDRESDGRFIASIPDLGDLAAYGDTDKDAVAHVTELAGECVRTALSRCGTKNAKDLRSAYP
jgi:predicted RNase H-like HicB family nuclease